ncbi:hypothetical protein AGR1B_pAt30430 [Agrobacterium fabacearum S56]|nr:hypothetical protein AGR1B_pAt30430 [Agrobacterium fabacearum S56]
MITRMPIFVVSLVVGAYFVDTGLLANLREGSLNSLRRDKIRRGAPLERRDVSSELFFGIGAPILQPRRPLYCRANRDRLHVLK